MTGSGGGSSSADDPLTTAEEGEEKWSRWLQTPNEELGNEWPVAAVKTPIGRQRLAVLFERFHEENLARQKKKDLRGMVDLHWLHLQLGLDKPLPYQSILGESEIVGSAAVLGLLTIGCYLLQDAIADKYDGNRGNYEFLTILPLWCVVAGTLQAFKERQMRLAKEREAAEAAEQ